MRKIIILGAVFAFALTSTAWAGAKDKSANTLADRNNAGVINNSTVKTSVKAKGCKMQVQAKPVNLADGEIVICIIEADVILIDNSPIGGNSILLTGEAKKGALKIKADLSEATVLGSGCGDADAVSYNGQIKCYRDDANYRSDAVAPGTWRQSCSDAGMTPGTVGTSQHKVNSGVPIVLGLCQGFAEGVRIIPPITDEWALTGQRNGIIE